MHNVTDHLSSSGAEDTRSPVSYQEAFRTWCRVAALSFGGPAGQIAVMHRIIVDEKKWISEERFLHALNYCMLLRDLRVVPGEGRPHTCRRARR